TFGPFGSFYSRAGLRKVRCYMFVNRGCPLTASHIARITRIIILVAICAPVAVLTGRVQAANFTVSNLNDSGAGSLRQAVSDASVSGGNVVFTVSGTITLTSGAITYSSNNLIQIQGLGGITVNGGNSSTGILQKTSGSGGLNIDGVTFTGSAATGVNAAPGVFLGSGNMSGSNSTF